MMTEQLIQAVQMIKYHLPMLKAIHLYGSIIDGGLKPYSDIDLFVTVSGSPAEVVRQKLLLDLLNISAPPGSDKNLRALEVTVVSSKEVVPWKHPAKRELQFGEWLRKDLLSGVFEQPTLDPDLAILLTKVRQSSIALFGPEAETLFEPVPKTDFVQTLAQTMTLWNSPKDWLGDERNVLLTMARIWYSAATGKIGSKDLAATWVLERLPSEHYQILHEAREAYLGHQPDNLTAHADKIKPFMDFAKTAVTAILAES